MKEQECQVLAPPRVILVEVIIGHAAVPVNALRRTEDVPDAADDQRNRARGQDGVLEIERLQGNVPAPEPVGQAEGRGFRALVKDHALEEPVNGVPVHRVEEKSKPQAQRLEQPRLGGDQMLRADGVNRQPVMPIGQGEGEGVVFEIGVDDGVYGFQDGGCGIPTSVGRHDVLFHQRPVAFLGLRLDPGGEPPGACRGADQGYRPSPAQDAALKQGQVEAAGHKPPGSGRRPVIACHLIKVKTAILDQRIGFFARLDADRFHFQSRWR